MVVPVLHTLQYQAAPHCYQLCFVLLHVAEKHDLLRPVITACMSRSGVVVYLSSLLFLLPYLLSVTCCGSLVVILGPPPVLTASIWLASESF